MELWAALFGAIFGGAFAGLLTYFIARQRLTSIEKPTVEIARETAHTVGAQAAAEAFAHLAEFMERRLERAEATLTEVRQKMMECYESRDALAKDIKALILRVNEVEKKDQP